MSSCEYKAIMDYICVCTALILFGMLAASLILISEIERVRKLVEQKEEESHAL